MNRPLMCILFAQPGFRSDDGRQAGDPQHDTFDVVIVGGAMIGSSVAWFLSHNEDFDGRILVVERDPTYGQSSTAHTNSCMRQQFSSELNIRISQFAAEFVRNFRDHMGGDPAVLILRASFWIHVFGGQ